jgi:DNA-binding helix-hairpin-helix protein with protein kinase domain
MLALGIGFQSLHFLTLAAIAGTSIWAMDSAIKRVHLLMVPRVKIRLRAAELRAVRANPEWNQLFEKADAAAIAARQEAERTFNVARALDEAAVAAQADFLVVSAAEAEARERRVETAKKVALETRTVLTQLASECRLLQHTIDDRTSKLTGSRDALTILSQQRDAAYKNLRDHDRQTQLNQFLDTHYINSAQIKGITNSLKSALSSFGIETAADVNESAVLNVPGFGAVRTKHMLVWRNHVTKKFRYTPRQDIDPIQRKAIESKYSSGFLRIARDFTTAHTELDRHVRDLTVRVATSKQGADEAVKLLVHAQADRKILNLT